MTDPVRIHGKRVLALLKETQTDWPDVKSWFAARKGIESFSPAEVAEKAGVGVALWAMRSVPGMDRAGRELSAAFAWGPDGALAEAYRAATKGCPMVEDGVAVLVSWLDGEATDEVARKTRWDLAAKANESRDGVSDVLHALACGFAQSSWGSCGLAHDHAVAASSVLLGKARPEDADGPKLAPAALKARAAGDAREYHVALIADLVG